MLERRGLKGTVSNVFLLKKFLVDISRREFQSSGGHERTNVYGDDQEEEQ